MSATYSLQSQQIATAGNVQIAGINAGVQTAAMGEAVKRAAISADMWKTGATTSAELALSNSSAMMSAFVGALGFASATAMSNNRAMAQQSASVLESQTAISGMKNQLAVLQSNNDLASLATDRSTSLALISENNAYSMGMSEAKNYFANLGNILKSNITLANIFSGTEKRESEIAAQNALAQDVRYGFNGQSFGGDDYDYQSTAGYNSSFSNPLASGSMSNRGWGSLATSALSLMSGNIVGAITGAVGAYNEYTSGGVNGDRSPGATAGLSSMSTAALSGWSSSDTTQSETQSDGGGWV